MNFVPTFLEPRSRLELLAAMQSLHGEATAFWNQLSDDYFFASYGTQWSPAENVRHLNLSTKPVAMALRLPKVLPRLLFGIARHSSSGFSQICERYKEALASGGQAGRYAPRRPSHPSNPAATRAKIMADWEKIWQNLIAAANRWDDIRLDNLQLPHPLLGKLTVREMLFFTLYHHVHHLQNVSRRLSDRIQAP